VVDDTVHYFSHFRDEFTHLGENRATMERALVTVGKALCFTSLLLTLGFGVFIFSSTNILFEFGLLSGIGVIFALAGDLFISSAILVRFKVFKKFAFHKEI
jgi:predicted RND superfamily exporter protein